LVHGDVQLKRVAVIGALAFIAVTPASASESQQPSVALAARPTVLKAAERTILRGAISSQREGEEVELRAKDCGQPSTRSIGVATTSPGGTFEQEFYAGVKTVVTAHWRNAVSAPVELRQEPRLFLINRRGRLEIGVGSKGWMWRKKVTIQRRAAGTWVRVKNVVLTDSASPSLGSSWVEAEFKLRVPRGTAIRAVLPRSQAKPCYLAGVSNTVRT
jgi:hypothetical protein